MRSKRGSVPPKEGDLTCICCHLGLMRQVINLDKNFHIFNFVLYKVF